MPEIYIGINIKLDVTEKEYAAASKLTYTEKAEDQRLAVLIRLATKALVKQNYNEIGICIQED